MDNGKDIAVASETEMRMHDETTGQFGEDMLAKRQGSVQNYAYDNRDMRRLGRRQELKRRFRYFSLLGYMLILASTWETALVTSLFSLPNGGTAGTIWMSLIVCTGQFFVTLSMAEMGSISPTAGGQYHWVSEFSAKTWQKPASYFVGWLCALGWQVAMPTLAYSTALQVLALIKVCNPDYTDPNWHGFLLCIAFTLFAMMLNVFAIDKLPFVEGVVVIIHFFGFFGFVALFWIMGARASATQTFLTFEDEYGWGSKGLACLVSIIGPAASLVGGDAAVHLAEELQNASYTLPRAMLSSALLNYATSFIMVISFVSAIGPNLQAVLSADTPQPWVAVIQIITNSKAATIVLVCLIAFQVTFATVNQVTTSSRQLWAFARDKGIPFHKFLSKVNTRDGLPRNALLVTLITTTLISCIIIGSTIAFNVFGSLCSVSLVISYMVAIGTLIAKRVRQEKLPPSRFDLGRWGMPINIIAMCWLTVLMTFMFFPESPNPTPAEMNWAVLMFGAVMIFAGLWYLKRGRHEYDGPVEYIDKNVL